MRVDKALNNNSCKEMLGDWYLSKGLKKEFFSGPQNTENASDPYRQSSVFWIQERIILD